MLPRRYGATCAVCDTSFSSGQTLFSREAEPLVPDKSSGRRVQEIEIAYDLIGIVPMELLNAVITGKAA